ELCVCSYYVLLFIFIVCVLIHLVLHSFPTRRSSDLVWATSRVTWFIAATRSRNRPAHGSTRLMSGSVQATTVASGNPCRIASERSEEHTSELQSRFDIVCRLLLEKKK